MKYTKPATDPIEQIGTMKDRGFIVANVDTLQKTIQPIGYYIDNASLDSDWLSRLCILLRGQPSWQLTLMGFGTDWSEKSPWKL